MTYSLICHSDPSGHHRCSLLKFENVTIMMDPAWDGNSGDHEAAMDFWAQLISQTDIVLLSQPTAESLGAYALLYAKFLAHFHSRIAVYATLPVANLGRVTTLDLYTSQGLVGPVESNLLDLPDIEEAFDHIISIKHSQILDLKSKFEGLTVVAYNSGYAPGGSIFSITTFSDKVIYAPRWNHTKDTILNSAAVLDISGKPSTSLMRPSAIVTSTSQLGSSLPYRKRASQFKDVLRGVLSKNGTAVIPCQIGGKFLDLLVLVNDMIYEQRRYRNQSDPSIFLVSYSRGRSLTYARSMLEWLSASVIKTWEGRNNRSPFDLGTRFSIVTPEELKKYSGPKVCFVSEVDRLINDVISALGTSDKTTVVLTEPCGAPERTNKILSSMHATWVKTTKNRDNRTLDTRPILFAQSVKAEFVTTEELQGEELEKFKSKLQERSNYRAELMEKLKKEARTDGASNAAGGLEAVDEQEDDDDDDDDVPDFITAVNRKANAAAKPLEIAVDVYINPEAQPRHKMFPFQPVKIKRDDYGDVVDFSQFVPNEQLEESDKRSAADAFAEDEDPYEIELTSKNSKKRRGGNTVKGSGNKKEENIDDVSYLNALNKPQRRSVSENNVSLRCSVSVVDLTSLVDQRSMSVIWPALKPRNMLLVAPKDAQNATAIKTLNSKLLDVTELDFNTPATFETLIRSLDVSVDPELDQRLKWQGVSDEYTIAHVVGRLVRDNTSLLDGKQHHRDKWVLKPLSNGSKMYPKVSLAIGDVRLAEVKRRMTEKNHVAEFKGEGSLVIDGKVVVRKISDSETVVDGSPSELFYKVKAAVADMLAKV
ncbi:LAFA_0E04610g1_1 [Lachancea sp. 'fantastica']|nr:LAFA_0E04610g1_1 [Lachancea sp. 'fantastica']